MKYAFAFDLPKFVTRTLKRRENSFQVEVLTQRMHFRPVIVQRAAARIGVANQFQTEQVRNLPLLPVDGGHRVGQRRKFGPLRRDRRAQNKKAVRRVDSEDVVNEKGFVAVTRVLRKQAYDAPVPLAVKPGAKRADRFQFCLRMNFVGARGVNFVNLRSKLPAEVVQNRFQAGQRVHGAPPMIWVVRCTSWNSGEGSQTPNTTTIPATNAIAPCFHGHTTARGVSSRGTPRFI